MSDYDDDSDWVTSGSEAGLGVKESRKTASISEDDATDEDLSRWEQFQAHDAEAHQIAKEILKAFSSQSSRHGDGDGDDDDDNVVSNALCVIQEESHKVAASFKPTPSQINILVRFSNALRRRSEDTGDTGHANSEFLGEATDAAALAILALSPAQPESLEQLDALSVMLAAKSRWVSGSGQERMHRINRAIDATARAVDLTTSGDPNEVVRLQSLSKLYESRYNLSNGSNPEDIDVAISSLQTILRNHPKLDGATAEILNNEISCLRLRRGDYSAVPSVFEVPYEDLGKTPLVLDHVPPHRFRFLDCKAYVEEKALRILDFKALPERRYAAVSYVWKGLGKDDTSGDPHPDLKVKGAEAADPMSPAVLRTICLASLSLECDMIWLDQVSIIQTNPSDASWQIKNMYRIYSACKACLVLPGGLRRLPGLAEQTSWIQRAWTLQEAVAPPRVYCIFQWPWGEAVQLQAHFSVIITDIETGMSGMAGLKNLLSGSLVCMSLLSTDTKIKGLGVQPINIFTNAEGVRSSVEALLGALNHDNKAIRAGAIWRSALMRTSSRPVDMIFSIMGLLGVMLEPSSFDKDDRIHATIEFARLLLAKGEAARWLGISLQLEPNRYMSTLPVMPETSVGGGAYIRTPEGLKEATQLVGSSWWWLKGAPRGSMDEEGYFRFKGRAVPVIKIAQGDSEITPVQTVLHGDSIPQPEAKYIRSWSEQMWALRPDLESGTSPDVHWVVVIGRKQQYLDGTYGLLQSNANTVVMFLEEHAPNRWNNVEYGLIEDTIVLDWKHKEFQVGGPEPIPPRR
ncbi:hypothetical protein SLS62_005637 [Diatrype stigma]|uniref:Heterokaryon incompatibility domain-containing protein n=1 Tax=Diatrype stigma TaxID=117547 RepID=A0AAN9UP05_9PEZI